MPWQKLASNRQQAHRRQHAGKRGCPYRRAEEAELKSRVPARIGLARPSPLLLGDSSVMRWQHKRHLETKTCTLLVTHSQQPAVATAAEAAANDSR